MENMLPELNQFIKEENSPEVTLYTGFKSISNFFRNILDELKKDDAYYTIGAKYVEELPSQRLFFEKYHKQRAKKGIKLMMMANEAERKNLVSPTSKISEVRFLPDYLVQNMQITFYKNKTFIVVWTNEPVGFLIESDEVTKSFKSYFDTFWKIAKK
jgi:hypothetical protein